MTYHQSKLTAAKTIELQKSDMPEQIKSGYLRLRLATASLCGTDMHYYRHFANAGFELKNPVTLGHEACAYVEDANGTSFKAGQLVAINPVINCGECDKCKTGDINMCAAKRFPGSATTNPHIDGFFREYFDFPAFCCHTVPDTIKPDHLTFSEPLACAMHSVNKGGIGKGSKVLVTGCGPMGLLACVAAISKGATVDVTDLRQEAVDVALSVGASKGYISGRDDFSELANSYDVVVEASGSPHGFNAALDCVRKQGTVSVLSIIQLSDTPIKLHTVMLKEIQIVGSALFTLSEFDQSVALITSGDVDFEKLVAARFPISETQDACELMVKGGAAGKILIKPN